jgi:hypothetical protein
VRRERRVVNRPDDAASVGRRRNTMDFWYELAIRELADVNADLLREAEEASRLPSAEPAEEQDE